MYRHTRISDVEHWKGAISYDNTENNMQYEMSKSLYRKFNVSTQIRTHIKSGQ